jgi:hypothetical protein
MLRICGIRGEIQKSELFLFNEDFISDDDKWKKVTDVNSAIDAKQLETQITSKMFNLREYGSIDLFIMMTDWSEGKDTAADRSLGSPGEPGEITVVKMDENFVFTEPKEINSRIPPTTRASSRATLPSGDKGGANISPTNGTELEGTYYNIKTFEVKAGVTLLLKNDTSLFHDIYVKIVAENIYINGTIDGAGRGSTGGWGGGGGMEGEGGEGPNSNAGGGNLGWGPTIVAPNAHGGGGGGGGGGFGGAGGAGGSGGGSNGGGYGDASSTYGDPNSYEVKMGSGGGGAGSGQETSGGNGGKGGHAIWLRAQNNLSISGIITVNGSDGQNGTDTIWNQSTGGGGGGGSGGGILIKHDSFTYPMSITGKLFANGGSGGDGGNNNGTGGDSGGGGGGGGGGRIKIFYNDTFINSSTMEYGGGSGGTGGTAGNGTGSDGSSGSAGTLYVIPEFSMIAIPISLTFLIIITLRLKARGHLRKSNGSASSTKEVKP